MAFIPTASDIHGSPTDAKKKCEQREEMTNLFLFALFIIVKFLLTFALVRIILET